MAGKRRPGSLRDQWRDQPKWRRQATVALGAVEVVATVMASADLARRPRSLVHGPKVLWWSALTVQPFGPFAYLMFGRRR